MRPEEGEPAGIMQRDQPGEEQPAEQLAQHPHRQEEGRARRYPAAARRARCRRPARSCGRADGASCAEPQVWSTAVMPMRAPRCFGIGGDRQHRLRGRPEQQVVDQRLVLEGDVGDLGRQREHDMEVADRQQVGLALGEPGARRGALALGAVPVAAAVVGDRASARSPRRPRRGRPRQRCGSARSPT